MSLRVPRMFRSSSTIRMLLVPTSDLRSRGRRRKADTEDRALAALAELDRAAVPFHDLAADREAQARALGLGAEQRLEDLAPDRFRHARPVVHDEDLVERAV